MGEGVVHVLRTHHVQLRVPDAVLFGKQEGEKLLRKKQKRVTDAEALGAAVQFHTHGSPLARGYFLSSAQPASCHARCRPAPPGPGSRGLTEPCPAHSYVTPCACTTQLQALAPICTLLDICTQILKLPQLETNK